MRIHVARLLRQDGALERMVGGRGWGLTAAFPRQLLRSLPDLVSPEEQGGDADVGEGHLLDDLRDGGEAAGGVGAVVGAGRWGGQAGQRGGSASHPGRGGGRNRNYRRIPGERGRSPDADLLWGGDERTLGSLSGVLKGHHNNTR